MNTKLRFLSVSTFVTFTAVALIAHGQDSTKEPSTTVTTASSTENISTTTFSEQKTETKSPWVGGILFIYDQAGRVKPATEDIGSTEYWTETHFRLKYEATQNDSFSMIQRVVYGKAVVDGSQNPAALWDLRLEYNRTGKLLDGDASLVTRTTLPTTLESRRDLNLLGIGSLLPTIYWNLTPKMKVGYSGQVIGEFYNDTPQMQGAAATIGKAVNSAVAVYSFNNKLSLAQSLGLSEIRRNDNRDLNHLNRICQTFEVQTALFYNPIKTMGFSLSANQSAPTMENAFDPDLGKTLPYEKNYALYSRDQTYYELTGSVYF